MEKVLGAKVMEAVQTSKILVVGAGGIGCELLKNLACTGFRDITVVDLDTIDFSNLNRQFLFRSNHVGKSKCDVARDAVMAFCPSVRIKSHHGNVKEARFGTAFVSQFDIVMNALDNVSARRHVNRMCLAADVPLIESGSTGYVGQATVIVKGQTECYDCVPKPTQKKFPVCTIRSTPDKPVHCIVWAKELFKYLFGDMSASMLNEGPAAPGNEADDGEDDAESVYTAICARARARKAQGQQELETYANDVLHAFFCLEIQKKLAIKSAYKGAEHAPRPIIFDFGSEDSTIADIAERGGSITQRGTIWTVAQCAAIMRRCIVKMWTDPDRRRTVEASVAKFDKDDALTLDFITAASNLRSHVFSIPMQSAYSVKGIAGNIVHAIATTNAIVAGLEVMEALKLVRAQVNGEKLSAACRCTAISRGPSRKGYVLQPSLLDLPNPRCYVCSKASLVVTMDTLTMTLDAFVDNVLRRKLGFNAPEFTCGTDDTRLFAYPDDWEDSPEEMGATVVSKLPGSGGICGGCSFLVTDESQGDVAVELVIVQKSDFDEEKVPDLFTVSGKLVVPAAPPVDGEEGDVVLEGEGEGDVDGEDDDDDDDDDDDMIILDGPPATKRSRLG